MGMNDRDDDAWWTTLLDDVRRFGELSADRRAELLVALDEVEPTAAQGVTELLVALTPTAPPPVDGRERLLLQSLERVVQPWLYRDPQARLTVDAVACLAAWYGEPKTANLLRFSLLRTLAVDGSVEALATLARLAVDAPPADERQAVMALVPLFQPRGESLPGAAALWPTLLDAVAHPTLASAVVDLANFVFRRRWVVEHPARERAGELSALLGELAQRLAQIEEHPERHAATPIELSRIVNEAVALIVGLCDALALAGDRTVIGKLRQLLELGHRRVQAEAAAALARLGEDEGVDRLLALAVEPAVRTRVLAYLDEVGKLEKLEAKWRSPEAQAEGELAAWMAQPTRFGVAPDELELVERRTQYWPGYVDPVDCYLFTYEFHRGEKQLGGVGIAGPMTAALQADLQDFPPDDIFALYAGLDAEHPDIFETAPDDLSVEQTDVWERVNEQLGSLGLEDRELVLWGNFFGEQFAVATATREGREGVVVVGDQSTDWIPTAAVGRGVGAREIYAMYKGRKLLKSFNRPPPDGPSS